MPTVYITRDALKHGIEIREATPYLSHHSDVVVVRSAYADNYYVKSEWHRTWSEAVARANQMRDEKIARLEEEIGRLRRMNFDKEAGCDCD